MNRGEARNRARTAHFMTQWGPPAEVHVRSTGFAPQLAVLEFPPRGARTHFRFATNGLSELELGSMRERVELYASTRLRALWAVDLLVQLCRYAVEYEVHLSEGDSLPAGRPIDGAQSPFFGLLLVAPEVCGDSPSLGAIPGLWQKPPLVHKVVGLYSEELSVAADGGSDFLVRRLTDLKKSLSLDESRAAVIASTGTRRT